MNDPHVKYLKYVVSSGDEVSYDNPKPLKFKNHIGFFDLSNGKLKIELAEHFSDEEEARKVVDPFLRAWQIDADLNSNIGSIRFIYESSEIIDLNPPPPGLSKTLKVRATEVILVGNSVSFHITKKNYPSPPISFRVTPEVEHAYYRWLKYRQGHEPLPAMSYFILTLLESIAGNRKTAANIFQIDLDVLDLIGKLSSTKGNAQEARKVNKDKNLEEFTQSEKDWLDKAILKIINRLGEHASGVQLIPITLKELPELK